MKVRDLQQELRALGCRPERITGSHERWQTPCRAHVTIVVNHRNADVTQAVLTDVRRVLRAEGIQVRARGGRLAA